MPRTFSEDLAQTFLSWTPILFVETAEDDRLKDAVDEVRMRVSPPPAIFTWSAPQGLTAMGDDGSPGEVVPNTQTPIGLLEHLVHEGPGFAAPRDAIVVAWDLVGANPQPMDPVQLRLMKDLFSAWERTDDHPQRTTFLMTGVGWSLPPGLAGYVDTRPLPLPKKDEIAAWFADADRRRRLDALGLDPEQLGSRASGLPRNTVEQIFRRMEAAAPTASASTRRSPLAPEGARSAALSILDEVKREEVRRTNLLELYPPEASVPLGGLNVLRRWIELRRDFLLEAGRDELRPRGVLLLGFPGCGKSLAARWIAAALQIPLVSMDVGRIQDRWVGSSEARMRTALRTLEAAAPLVLFIDEIEKGLAGSGNDTSGVTDRLVGQLLTWLSDHQLPVFVVATCNKPKIPPELTRAGRFDANFVVLLPNERERREICEVLVRALRLELAPEAAERVIKGTPEFSGAEIRQVLVEAAYRAGLGKPIKPEHVSAALPEVTPLSRRREGRELRDGYQQHIEEGGYRNAGGDA